MLLGCDHDLSPNPVVSGQAESEWLSMARIIVPLRYASVMSHREEMAENFLVSTWKKSVLVSAGDNEKKKATC